MPKDPSNPFLYIKTGPKNYFKIESMEECVDINQVLVETKSNKLDIDYIVKPEEENAKYYRELESIVQKITFEDSQSKQRLMSKLVELKPKNMAEVAIIASSDNLKISNTLLLEISNFFTSA